MIEIILNILAVFSVFIIIYGFARKIENKYMEIIIDFFIIVSTFLVALSIYFPVNTRVPEEFSKNYSAPIVLISLFCLFIYWLYDKKSIPPISIKGIALLGLSGALFRLVSY